MFSLKSSNLLLSLLTSMILPIIIFSFHFPMKKLNNYSTITSKKLIRNISLNMLSVSDVLKNPKWPDKWPFQPNDFSRQDNMNDNQFYNQPRYVYHIDEYAVNALTSYYKSIFKSDTTILDICSSWVSHYPKDIKFKKASGIGMNSYELSKNDQLTDYVVQDLNMNPIFPYADNMFDYVTCVVLKPGGIAIISQSNRCFPTKAINIWLNTNDLEHIFIIGSYFHYAQGYQPPEAFDISPYPNKSDPMFIIQAKKI